MNQEKDMMKVTLDDGTTDEVEILLSFEFNDNKKEYIIYTKNETDENGNVTIYVSSVSRSVNGTVLGGIDDENEWTRIKEVLRELSKDEE